MQVDKIYKNARIFTADPNMPEASSFALKDGKFAYVGNEAGLAGFEGEVHDLAGKFAMPALMDSHVHIPVCVIFAFSSGEVKPIRCSNKQECLDFIAQEIAQNPGQDRYCFRLKVANLAGERLTKEDLDALCSDCEIVIQEDEAHSAWANSLIFERAGITDATPDIIPGLSYYERDEKGHLTGRMFEMTQAKTIAKNLSTVPEEKIEPILQSWIEFCCQHGVSAVFEAGSPSSLESHERVYDILRNMDAAGELPVFIDGCCAVVAPRELEPAFEALRRFRKKYRTPHLRVNTLKIILDGTLRIRTASLLTPYEGTDEYGSCVFDSDQLTDIIKRLNAEDFNLHVHTVGEGASRAVLDAVERAQKELGDAYRTHVTCAHLELVNEADIPRFAELGVTTNYTPWWSYGDCGDGSFESTMQLLGEKRAHQMYRTKSVIETGANVCFSSDSTVFAFDLWNPYLGMEVAQTRCITEKTNMPDEFRPACTTSFPEEAEKVSVEDALKCFTINNARQLHLDERKGSIEVGKDADFLIFDEDLLAREPEGLSFVKPAAVFFEGQLVFRAK